MPYNLATAALATGVNKSTILRAIKAGRLTATRDDAGWTIEVAELHRVFAPLPAAATAGQPPTQRDAITDELVRLLREQLDDMRAQLSDLRQDRDHWHEAFQATQPRLPPPVPQPTTEPPPPSNRLVRAWRWMRATTTG